MIGINNRNLDEGTVDVATTYELMPDVPAGKTVVAESGISERGRARGARAGRRRRGPDRRRLMRADDPRRKARELTGSTRHPRAPASLSGAAPAPRFRNIFRALFKDGLTGCAASSPTMSKRKRFLKSPFGSALLGGLVVAVVGLIAIAAGWVDAPTASSSPSPPRRR